MHPAGRRFRPAPDNRRATRSESLCGENNVSKEGDSERHADPGLAVVDIWHGGSIFDQFDRGVAIISFEYALADEEKWPAQAHDGKAAVRWLRSNAGKYNIDPKRIFVAGASAGAILANVVANSAGDGSLHESGVDYAGLSAGVSSVVSFYTAADRRFDKPAVSDLITRFLSGGHQDDGLH